MSDPSIEMEGISAAGHAYSLGQLTVTAEDPYVQAVQTAHPDITPALTINSTTTSPSSIQTTPPTTGHRTTHKRVRGASDIHSDDDEEPQEESEEDPQEESEEDPQEEPEEDPATAAPAGLEVAPAGHIIDSAGGDRDVGVQTELSQERIVPWYDQMILTDVPDTFEIGQSSTAAQIQGTDAPLGLGQRAAMIRAREESLDGIPTTFEIGQSSRGAYQEENDGVIWRDIECVFSTAPRVESPDYTPSTPPFVIPPSPVALQPVTPHTEEEDLTDGERVILQLETHESLLDVHTDQLERLQGQEQRVETVHRAAGVLLESVALIRQDVYGLRARVDGMGGNFGRELRDLDARIRSQGRGVTGLHGRVEDMDRTLWIARDSARTHWQRTTTLESMMAAEMRYARESRRRIEELEATQHEIIASIERLRPRCLPGKSQTGLLVRDQLPQPQPGSKSIKILKFRLRMEIQGEEQGVVATELHRNVNDIFLNIEKLEQRMSKIEQFYSSTRKKLPNADKASSFVKDKNKDKQITIGKRWQLDAPCREAAAAKRMQDLMHQFDGILNQHIIYPLQLHKWAGPFMQPVDVVGLGLHDYYEISFEEKRTLVKILTKLSPDDLQKALLIVAQNSPNFEATCDEVELDMDTQSESILWKLKFFLRDIIEAHRKNSPNIQTIANNNISENNLKKRKK
ncbi:hypothetical protein CTI12_AA458700 [Artemisia annua]|uniref:NET domain-containing protein n=1 Tax=Artemisia annua TaxID=35608 RepID=A0A2U1LS93_ARTAN|nr:hypothetical protein CTI12_AA458700 [Artemisia annua]